MLPALLLALACADTATDTATDTGADTAAADDARSALTDGGSYRVAWTPDPDPIPFNTYFSLEVTVADADGAALPDATIAVDAGMPAHGHGMNSVPEITPHGDGGFTVDGMLFHMEGAWQVEIEVTDAAGVETATFDVDCCEA